MTPILEREEDRKRREALSWIAGKEFETIDSAFEWLGKEAERFGLDPHKYMELIDLLMKSAHVYDSKRPLGSGLYEIKMSYINLKTQAKQEFQDRIRMVLVGLQIRAITEAIAHGGERGFLDLTGAFSARFLEQTLYGDNLLREFPWEQIISSLKVAKE
ncbi:MAG: hypothetical protein HY929_07295 [Euryarchaeota archaeon]|nr:hypothetical protein [Euryarchaeota archaeon]